MAVEGITDREGVQRNTATEKADILTCKAFPLNDDNQFHHLLPDASVHSSITEHAVE